nr:unnamed protein product [Digitaria exilis]CAB3492336.1 unnamed protein product [Digitaria exilis]
MAATPEEFLFVDPEPPSPSVFLDLPPTPPPPLHDDDDDPGAFDDMVLPYVARLLMDEEATDEDSFFYQYPDHPALLQAQLPFAQILSDAAAIASGDTTTTTSSPSFSVDTDDTGSPGGGEDRRDISISDDSDMVTSAFLKGIEQATKFLPTITNNALFPIDHSSYDAHARGRKNSWHPDAAPEPETERATKIMAPDPYDEEATRQMFDEMMLNERDISMKGVEQQQVPAGDKKRRRGRPRRSSSSITDGDDTVDLHELLLRCAQAMSTDDHRTAHSLLAQIRRHSSPTGDATQRLAHCFAEGLEARLAGNGSRLYNSLMVRPTSTIDFLKAYQLFMSACCCKKVAFAFSNKTIFDAVAGHRRLHIVDYGLGYGFQWPGLLRGLAARDGGPPAVRITGIDLPQPGFRPAFHVEETGRRLGRCALELGVPFTFRGIAAAKREDLVDIAADPADDEVLVVSSLCHFRHLMDESVVVGRASPRDQVLGNIRRMRPDVFIHGVVNGGHGSGYFPTRFREALFFFGAQFELLDATVARDSPERMVVERDMFGAAAMNVIACEGGDRVERPETYRQWQARNQRAGLTQLPLRREVVKVVVDKVRDKYHADFAVDQDHEWLLHRWKGRVLYGLSTWTSRD